MNYQKYIDDWKELYRSVLQFLDVESIDDDDDKFQEIINIVEDQAKLENTQEMTIFFRLLIKISNHHHRFPSFFQKIYKIFDYFFEYITQTFSKKEIFDIIKSNKPILLFFIKKHAITIDNDIVHQMLLYSQKTNSRYHYYFYPEIKDFLTSDESSRIENEILAENQDYLTNFEEIREKGENDSHICRIIREDSVEAFVTLTNQNPTILRTTITPSIFETNLLLIKTNPTLIQYSAFYGSIQIFQYLKYSSNELNPSLWIYAIHSQNPELVHLLEQYEVDPPNNDFWSCFCESIICHHNGIARYIHEVLLHEENVINYKYIIKCCNFEYLPNDVKNNSIFFNSCFYGFSDLVDLYIKPDLKDKLKPEEISKALENDDTERIYISLLKTDSKNKSFQNKSNLTQIAFPPTLMKIGINHLTFINCSKLTQVSIPSSVTYIGDYCFESCISLTHISIPSSVTYIGFRCFECCKSLNHITIPSSVNKIYSRTFCQCNSLEKIVIPSSVAVIEWYAFSNCSSLKEVLFENNSSLNVIRGGAFSDCTSLKEITIPSSVTEIGYDTFDSCTSLKKVDIPSSVNTIGDHAFRECNSLDEISIPSSVDSIGYHAFQGCDLLEDLCNSDSEGENELVYEDLPFCSFFFCFIAPASLNLIVLLIIEFVWGSRIRPFGHAYKTGKIVDVCLQASVIMITIIIFLFAFVLIITLVFTVIMQFDNKRRFLLGRVRIHIHLLSLVIFSVFFISVIVMGVVASAFALQNKKIDGKSIKCLNYIFDGARGAADWASSQSEEEQKKFQEWYSKMLTKAYKKNGEVTNYYCIEVGVPTLIFSITLIPFLIYAFIRINFVIKRAYPKNR